MQEILQKEVWDAQKQCQWAFGKNCKNMQGNYEKSKWPYRES